MVSHAVMSVFYDWKQDYVADNGYAHYVLETWRGWQVGKVIRQDEYSPYSAYIGMSTHHKDFDTLHEATEYVENSVWDRRSFISSLLGGE